MKLVLADESTGGKKMPESSFTNSDLLSFPANSATSTGMVNNATKMMGDNSVMRMKLFFFTLVRYSR